MKGRKLRTPADARRFLLGVELDGDELAARIVEGMIGIRRPPGMTATAVLDQVVAANPIGAVTIASARKAAASCAAYFAEAVNKGAGIN